MGATLFLVLFTVVLFCILVPTLSFGLHAFFGAPWIRTSRPVGRAMLQFAELKAGETVLDLGAGDGSIALLAAREFGARAYGIEWQTFFVWVSRLRALISGQAAQATFVRGDIFRAPWPEHIDVVTCFLLVHANIRLEPVLKERLRPGTRIVSRTFTFPTLPLIHSQPLGKGETLYLYEIPPV